MAMQPWRDPSSPVAGWQVANARFGGGEGALQQFRWGPAPGGDASQDAGLHAELERQRIRQEARVARVIDADGVIDRPDDLALNPLGGGGFGGVDRNVMAHVVSQDVPVAPQIAPAASQSRRPRRFNVCERASVCVA